MKYIVLLFLGLLLFSCEKEEEPIKPFDRGNTEVVSISTGTNGDYSNQIFYDLNENKVVKTVDRNSWDLGFESAPNGFFVKLNSSNKMQASKTGVTDFNAVTDLNALTLNYTWDHSSGLADSLALRDWINNSVPSNEVFIIDRGEAPNFSARGIVKMQVLSVTATDYTIRYANVDGSDEHTFVVPKDVTKNNTCFSFSNGGEVINVEPNKNDWDLLFTQYTASFYVSNPPLAYSVNGTLLNTGECKGAKVFDKDFANITIADVANYNLTDTLDVIGYDWKHFDMDASQYVVDSYKNYLIQDKLGFYYKFRFVDFYDDQGVKGTPKFEVERL